MSKTRIIEAAGRFGATGMRRVRVALTARVTSADTVRRSARGFCLLALVVLPRLLAAQGVTTAAIEGRVAADDGSVVGGARVELVNTVNGRRWVVATRPDGRFLLDAVAVGVYRVAIRALGFAPEIRTGVALTLGQRAVADFTLRRAAIELPPVTVRDTADPVLDAARTGPAEVVTRPVIAALPTPGRDLLDLTLLSPQVALSPTTPAVPTGGLSIGGQHRGYNSFQIDGGVHHDLFRGQLPGGREAFPRPLSFEALEELQVLVAPFDVRHGGFTGGVVNAVTRSGGNTVHGSLFGYLSDAALVRRGGIGGQVGNFTTWQFGGTAGGPIVRDRAHYFVSVDVQRRVVPDPGPLLDAADGDTTEIGVSHATAVRVRDVLDTLYALDAGSLGPVDEHAPARDILGKVSVQLATNHQLEATYHHVHGERRDFLLRADNSYAFSSRAQRATSTSHAARLAWTSLLAGGWSNELLVSYLQLRDTCTPRATFPELQVDVGNVNLLAGPTRTCPPSGLRQDVLELTQNASFRLGAHVVSGGLHGEWMRFRDDLLQGSLGLWIFGGGVDALEAGTASQYQRTLPGPSWRGAVELHAATVGLYAQDRWRPAQGLTLTAGLRVDVPILPDDIATNAVLRDSLGLDTGRLPSGHVLWSPRLGINYDPGGRGRTFLRGGIGLFSGRPLYRWIANAYHDDGTQELFLACREEPFEPLNQPDRCDSDSRGPSPQLSLFAPGTRPPQSLKVAAGLDQRLPMGLVGTLDVVYTRGVQQYYATDANLEAPTGASPGEGNRPLYGTFDTATGRATPTRPYPSLDQVVVVSNRSGDEAWSLAAQLRSRWRGPVEASALYAFTRARDRMSIVHVAARAMLGGTMLDGTLEQRRPGVSFFEIPHRAQVMATLRLPFRSSVSLRYAGQSSWPFTYAVRGDANADGMGAPGTLFQDPVYVPRDRADISIDGNGMVAGLGTVREQDSAWADLDAFIRAVPCLRNQRGRIMARNSCRNPWFGTLDARLTKLVPTFRGHALEIAATVYNVLNLINGGWGVFRTHGVTFATPLLVLRRYDTVNGRGIYEVDVPNDEVNDLASRWQVELSVRYGF